MICTLFENPYPDSVLWRIAYQDSVSTAYPLPDSGLLEKHVQSPTFWHVPRRDPAKLGNSTKKRCIRKTSPQFHPPGKTLSDSDLLEIHDQDKLFLGNTFSTDPKSAHFQNPPLISTILACHYPGSAHSKKAPGTGSPVPTVSWYGLIG